MKLSVFSLKKIIYRGEAESLNCKTEAGEITILENHRPLISALKPGVMKIIDKNKRGLYFNVGSGFLENRQNRIKVIAEEE